MNSPVSSPKAAQMRTAFDVSFSLPDLEQKVAGQAMLALGLNGDPYALRVNEIVGLASGREVVAVPGPQPAFLGLTGFRGSLMPVWDLAALLGYGKARSTPRWLVLVAGPLAWAAAFERFDGYFSLPQHELHPLSDQGRCAAFVEEACILNGTLRPLIQLSLVLDMVKTLSQPPPTRSIE